MARNYVYEFGKRKENTEGQEARLTPEKWEKIQESLKKYVKADEEEYVKVIHAHWITHNKNNPLFIYGECSNCGQEVSYKSNYCPNCGAKMEGENDDIR